MTTSTAYTWKSQRRHQLINIIRRWRETQDQYGCFGNLFRIICELNMTVVATVSWPLYLACVFSKVIFSFTISLPEMLLFNVSFRHCASSAFLVSLLGSSPVRFFLHYLASNVGFIEKSNNSKFNTSNLCNARNNNLPKRRMPAFALCCVYVELTHSQLTAHRSINSTYVRVCTGHENKIKMRATKLCTKINEREKEKETANTVYLITSLLC